MARAAHSLWGFSPLALERSQQGVAYLALPKVPLTRLGETGSVRTIWSGGENLSIAAQDVLLQVQGTRHDLPEISTPNDPPIHFSCDVTQPVHAAGVQPVPVARPQILACVRFPLALRPKVEPRFGDQCRSTYEAGDQRRL